jgi:DNA-directed RNA polymerase specialized sigma subunit
VIVNAYEIGSLESQEYNAEIERVTMDRHSSISGFDALQRDDALERLVQCIAQLARTQKTVLALYYYEDVQPGEIAACLGLTEREIDQIRAETLELLQTKLAVRVGLAELPEIGPSTPTPGDGIKTGGVGDEPVFLSQ